jgi:hypothetical protein
MGIPHTLLTVIAMAGLWYGGHFWCTSTPDLQPSVKPPAFAVFRSAFGSMMARMMKDSLYSYWHDGKSAGHAAKEAADHAVAPPAGRLGRLGRPAAPVATAEDTDHHDHSHSWLDRRVEDLARLESLRTQRNSPFPTSAAHRRYINASADWRLRLAYQLDPGDSTLYEILNFHLSSQKLPPEVLRPMLNELAYEAIYHGLRERSGVNEALTGAGAAVNLLNDQLQRNQPTPPSTFAILRNWKLLNLSLERYRTVRAQGLEEGWWEEIPAVRLQEIETYAGLLEKIAGDIKRQLVEMKLES